MDMLDDPALPEPPNEPTDETFLAPHFFPSLCQHCKSGDPALLKRCGTCKLVRYCSPAHQKEHWPLHKEFCRAEKRLPDAFRNIETFDKNIILRKISLLERELKRPLYVDELEMLQFQEHCNYCKSLNTPDTTYCDKCLMASYCNNKHKSLDEFHENWCFQLALCRLSYVHGIKWKADISKSVSLSSAKNMVTFFKENRIFIEAVKLLEEKNIASEEERDLVQLLNLSERLSYPLTFLYGVQSCNLTYKENMAVHIVGAEAYIETLNLRVWSVIVEQLKSLTKKLTLHLIGASLLFAEKYRISREDLSVTFEIIPSLYETFCSSESYQVPDAVICYNSGIHEKGPWLPALRCLVPKSGVPLIITSYTLDEGLKDVDTLCEAYEGKLKTTGPRLNPFASLRPYRNWSGDPETPENGLVFYHNASIAVMEL